SPQFRSHCVFIAEFYISMLKQASDNNSTVHFYTQTQLHSIDYLIEPHPDAYVAIEKTDGTIERYFIEIFKEMAPRKYFVKRVMEYIEYFEDETWQEET